MNGLRALSDQDRVAWLRLARAPNVGAVTFSALIDRFGSAAAALSELPRLVMRGGGEARAIPTADDAKRELETLAKLGGRFVASCEPEFPSSLSALDAPPQLLLCLEDPNCSRAKWSLWWARAMHPP